MSGNLENCVDLKLMTKAELEQAMVRLAGRIDQPLGIGVWEGEVAGSLSGSRHTGQHVAVFNDSTLSALFGPRGDAESEATAMMLLVALRYAEMLRS